jgi:hypothetical protein
MSDTSPRFCPRCAAAPGDPCRTASGNPAPLHSARIACPKCGAARVDTKCWSCGYRIPRAPATETAGEKKP